MTDIPLLSVLLHCRELYPQGQTILSATAVRDGVVVVTDRFVYHFAPDDRTEFVIRQMSWVP